MAKKPGRPRGPSTMPRLAEWIAAAMLTYGILSEMIGRWDDQIPGQARVDLIKARDPIEELLIQSGRLAQGTRRRSPR